MNSQTSSSLSPKFKLLIGIAFLLIAGTVIIQFAAQKLAASQNTSSGLTVNLSYYQTIREIEAGVIQLLGAGQTATENQNLEASSNLIAQITELQGNIQKAKVAANNDSSLLELEASLNAYTDALNKPAAITKPNNPVASANPLFQKARDDLSSIADSANEDLDLAAAYQAEKTKALLNISQIALLQSAESGIAPVFNSFKQVRANMDLLNEELQNPARKQTYREVNAALLNITDLVQKIESATANAKPEEAVTDNAASILLSALKNVSSKTNSAFEKELSAANAPAAPQENTEQLMIVLNGIFIVLGLLVAAGLSRSLSTAPAAQASEEAPAINVVEAEPAEAPAPAAVAAAPEPVAAAPANSNINTDQFEQAIRAAVSEVNAAAGNMHEQSSLLSESISKALQTTQSASAKTHSAQSSAKTVAQSAEQLSTAISEIGKQVVQSSSIASKAVESASNTNKNIELLAKQANDIGDIINLIHDIAEQTSLLALNATIEAARAGDAGKGFAVVADEVKMLASQTSQAANDIVQKITDIQDQTNVAAESIGSISSIIEEMNQITTGISSAVEQQSASTREIAQNISLASNSTNEIASAIEEVESNSNQNSETVSKVLKASEALSAASRRLSDEMQSFINDIQEDTAEIKAA